MAYFHTLFETSGSSSRRKQIILYENQKQKSLTYLTVNQFKIDSQYQRRRKMRARGWGVDTNYKVTS